MCNSVNPEDSYKTTDIDIASFLVSEGHTSLVGVSREGHRKYFVLSPAPDQDAISDFVNNQITVKPAGLLDTRRRLVTALQGKSCNAA